MPALRDTLKNEPVALAFGTSGMRALVSDMTDLECYINTTGFLEFVYETYGPSKERKVYLSGDLRSSTPRILAAVHQAISDRGYDTVFCGLVPVPALALYAQQHQSVAIMVTGSHIPDDRNGIKFYKPDGEVLKEDEVAIHQAVSVVRARLYASDAEKGLFNADAMLHKLPKLPDSDGGAAKLYTERYTSVFDNRTLEGMRIVFYQQSCVGRDLLPDILTQLGAEVVPADRSDAFVPIDTENITPANREYFKALAGRYPDCFAILSADGDSDRPFVIDETGVFHRGDVLGAVTADWLELDFAAYPVSASDAVDQFLQSRDRPYQHTRIGSPYVLTAMLQALSMGKERVGGWEVNGGFLLGSDVRIGEKTLTALPTRDTMPAFLGALISARKSGLKVSELFDSLPQRFTQQGLLDNFAPDTYRSILDRFSANTDTERDELGSFFKADDGFGTITNINTLDGLRMFFDNGEIAHIRLSANAPQLRMYSVATTQERADQIVDLAVENEHGIFRLIQQFVDA
jgi:phosphomannomutase